LSLLFDYSKSWCSLIWIDCYLLKTFGLLVPGYYNTWNTLKCVPHV
jgi:hypothetical protein